MFLFAFGVHCYYDSDATSVTQLTLRPLPQKQLSVTAPTFEPSFIKKTQINPEFSNFSVYQGWDDFRDQSVVCQDI